jgi:TRAP-type uncharacterized transport system fused permease subunit
MKIAAAGFVIPFMAVYSPELMLQNASDKSLDMFTLSVIYICIKVTLAIVFWGLAVIGHFKVRLNWTERLLGVIAAALFVPANPWMDITGFILGIIITFLIWYRIKNISKINS